MFHACLLDNCVHATDTCTVPPERTRKKKLSFITISFLCIAHSRWRPGIRPELCDGSLRGFLRPPVGFGMEDTPRKEDGQRRILNWKGEGVMGVHRIFC
jgi:hypothetical protein